MRRALELIRKTTARLAAESGVTVVIVMLVAVVAALVLAASYVAANGEIHLTSTDRAQRRAYYAAQAGISNYLFHLTQDGHYLSYCTEPPVANAALNQLNKTGTNEPLLASELSRSPVPGTAGASENEEYAIQLLPAQSDPETVKRCNGSNLAATMIEKGGPVSGTFSIRSTGFAGPHCNTVGPGCEVRSIIATFLNVGFPSFVYYTMFETDDPTIHETFTSKQKEGCAHFFPERYEFEQKEHVACGTIWFYTFDHINGPMHSEDHVAVCGHPTFGRNEYDMIEFHHEGTTKTGESTAEAEKGYSAEGNSGCEASPVWEGHGHYVRPKEVKEVTLPPSNSELYGLTEPEYRFTGRTEVVLEGESLTVINPSLSEPKKLAFPTGGVLYVSGSCSENYTPYHDSYTESAACGNVYVRGNYTKSLTIGAEGNIIINGNLTTPMTGGVPNTSAELGLVANKFVRIYHPVKQSTGATPTKTTKCVEYEGYGWRKTCKRYETTYTCSSGAYNKETGLCEYINNSSQCDAPTEYAGAEGKAAMKTVEVDAAILAVNDSFIVDNFRCPEYTPLEKLKVYGAIAQKFRGPVGMFFTTTGEAATGYTKEYEYDERLRASVPPHFLNPVQAPWNIIRETLAPTPAK